MKLKKTQSKTYLIFGIGVICRLPNIYLHVVKPLSPLSPTQSLATPEGLQLSQ